MEVLRTSCKCTTNRKQSSSPKKVRSHPKQIRPSSLEFFVCSRQAMPRAPAPGKKGKFRAGVSSHTKRATAAGDLMARVGSVSSSSSSRGTGCGGSKCNKPNCNQPGCGESSSSSSGSDNDDNDENTNKRGGRRGCCCSWRNSRVTPFRIAALIFFALGLALLIACMFYAIVDSSSESVVIVHSDLSLAPLPPVAIVAAGGVVIEEEDGLFGDELRAVYMPPEPMVVVEETPTFVGMGTVTANVMTGDMIMGLSQLPHCSHCSSEQRLVCGEDGLTYHNRCFSQCQGVAVLNAGRCRSGGLPPPVLYHPMLVT